MIFFILGFFSLIAQTLLFREAFQVYEGSELGIGIFFGSWMLWVAMGAWFSRFLPLPAFLKNVPQCLPLLYIPAYFLESYGITHARDLSGVLAYEIYPYGEMLFSSLLVLAPVSFVTGLLFALSCRIFQDQGPHIISRVYILESLGAFSGGIWVTLALYFGVADSTLLFSSLPLLAAAIIQRFYRRKPILLGGVVILLTLPLLFRFDLDLDQKRKELLWQQYLQGSTPEGGFRTSGGLYLYGHVEDQFIVLDRSGTVETFPSASPAAELIGTVLSQHPKARDFLVIGNQSLGLSHALLTLPQTGRISLLHPDPEFYPTLSKTLKDRSHDPVLRALGRVEILAEDSRRVLASRKSNFDLILLNLPDPDTAVLNRFFSQEFFKILRASLRTGGVLAVRVSGGENYLGEELAYLGASTQATLRSVYKNTVFRAGEDSWFLASDSDDLSESPALLRDRILTIREIKSIFDPQLLMSLYLPDRIQFQKMKYQEVLNREG